MPTPRVVAIPLVIATSAIPGWWGCEYFPSDPPAQNGLDPVIAFVIPDDGSTQTKPLEYGAIQVEAWDPDMGTTDGDGISHVQMVVTDADTGERVTSRTERWSTYDFGPKLPDGTYVFEATATARRSAGGTSASASITLTIDVDGQNPPTTAPPTTNTTAPTTTVAPTTAPTVASTTTIAPPTTPAPNTTLPTTTAPPVTSAPTTAPPTTTPATTTPATTTPATTTPATTAPPTTAPATTTAPPSGDATGASLAALNDVRASVGALPLVINSTMSNFAVDWSQEMSRSGFRHSSGPYGENIAWYSDDSLTPQAAARYFNDAWVNSPGHYSNMINAGYTEVGIGLFRDSSGWWATHVFR